MEWNKDYSHKIAYKEWNAHTRRKAYSTEANKSSPFID